MVCLDCLLTVACCLVRSISCNISCTRTEEKELGRRKKARVFGAILASRTHPDLLQQVPPSLFAADNKDNATSSSGGRELHVGLCISPRTSLKKNSSGFMNHSIERRSNSQDFVHYLRLTTVVCLVSLVFPHGKLHTKPSSWFDNLNIGRISMESSVVAFESEM